MTTHKRGGDCPLPVTVTVAPTARALDGMTRLHAVGEVKNPRPIDASPVDVSAIWETPAFGVKANQSTSLAVPRIAHSAAPSGLACVSVSLGSTSRTHAAASDAPPSTDGGAASAGGAFASGAAVASAGAFASGSGAASALESAAPAASGACPASLPEFAATRAAIHAAKRSTRARTSMVVLAPELTATIVWVDGKKTGPPESPCSMTSEAE